MGQFSHLKAVYGPPPVAPQDKAFQQKVDEHRNSLTYLDNPTELSAHYRDLRLEKDALEAKIRDLNVKIAAHENGLVSWLEGASLTQFKDERGYTFFIKDTPYTSVEDTEKWMGWIRETGQEDLLTVHYQTMNGIVSDRLKNGQPVPPGLKVYMKTGINMRKGTQ